MSEDKNHKSKPESSGDSVKKTTAYSNDVHVDTSYSLGRVITSGTINLNQGTVSGFSDFRVTELSRDLDAVRKQLSSIQREASVNAALADQVQTLANLVEQAQAKSNDLKAPVLLPPMEDMEVRLVASHSLERLEEYRSDENKYYLLIGLFGGAVLGILSNWFTNEQFTITRFSTVFVLLLVFLTIACILMASRISKRAEGLKSKIFRANISNPEVKDTQETK
jgi:hypothetical protein